jgi:hypothetical protein
MLISLGHSCQTRFILDAIDPSTRRMPFDFNITPRAALLAALDSDGQSLRHDEDGATPFREPKEGREGIAAAGMFFWHDYPLAEDRLRLADGWQRDIDRVNAKYVALWGRLSALLRSDEPKTLALSNSQHNLGQFADGPPGFAADFGLDRKSFLDLAAALDRHGARNYTVLFLSRSVGELADTQDLDDPRLDHRFVGILSLRPDARVADSIKARAGASMVALAGDYDGGTWRIVPRTAHVALVQRRDDETHRAAGSITLSDGHAVLWREGRDGFVDIRVGDGEIRFADGSLWRKDE